MATNIATIGRRKKSRLRLGIPARLDLVAGMKPCRLDDISKTGVRLHLENAPRPGECGVLYVNGLEAFGTVVWSNRRSCGIRFDRPVSEGALIRLRQDGDLSKEAEKRASVNFAKKWAQGR